MKNVISIVLVLIGSAMVGVALQKPSAPAAKPAAKTPPKPAGTAARENVYADSWDVAEQKSCTTFSSEPHLLICDDSKMAWDGAFIHLLSRKPDLPEDTRYREAFLYATTHSKAYIVRFSKNPWPAETTARRMALWDCSKNTSAITCKFNVEEDK